MIFKLMQRQEGIWLVSGGIAWRSVQCLYGVCKWDGNSNFASDIYGARVIFMHVMVIERCGEKRANR